MNRRKVCSLSVAFLLGIAAAEYGNIWLWFLLILYGMAWMYSVKKDAKKPVWTVLLLLAFLTAVFCGSYDSYRQKQHRNTYESDITEDEICLIQGEIYKREPITKENEKENFLFYLKNCRLQFNQKDYSCNQILLYLNTDSYSIGEILCVKGKIKKFSLPVNEGNYNEKEYYQSLNIDFKFYGELVVSVHGKRDNFREWLNKIKEKMKKSYEDAMPKADTGVLTAMTLGDKSLMDAERKTIYQNAGISHFYSISGLHISMIGMTLYQFFKKRSGSYLISGAIAAILILGYGELTGFGISTSRAVGMFLLLLYAKYRGRSYDRITALALAAAVLAGKNPQILHHAGYLLSFGAVFGVVFSEWIMECFDKMKEEKTKHLEKAESYRKKFFLRIRDTFLVSFCIQLVTIPILCQFFYEISIYAVLINFVVLPCMGILLGMGILGGITGCFFPFFGKLFLYPCDRILWMFDVVCKTFLKIPGAVLITGKLPVSSLLIWYGLLFLFFIFKKYKKGISVLLLFLPFCLLIFPQKQKAVEFDVLDVGQGDGIYISAGDGTSVFIDGGSSSVSKPGTYRILPFLKCRGIRQMDYWFVSHCDSDHINGLCEVIEADYRIKNLVVSEYMPQDAAWQQLEELAESRNIPIIRMKKADTIKSYKKEWSIKCLSFAASADAADRNENSLVLLFESKMLTGFFAGDIGMEMETKLAEKWKLSNIDVYKASHHGSNYSNCSELLQKIHPKMTVISCAMKNSYGHPGEEALKRMIESGSKIYETRHLGQIKIKAGHLEAEGYSVLE